MFGGADLLRGFAGMRAGIDHDAAEFLEQLLEVNSASVQSDVDERLREGRKNLETEIQTLLHEVETIADCALVRARAAQTSGTAAVQTQLARLEAVEREIHSICQSRGDLAKRQESPPGRESER